MWHQYTIRVRGGRDARDRLQAGLRERGIESATFYPAPIHRQPLYTRLGYDAAELPSPKAGERSAVPARPPLAFPRRSRIDRRRSERVSPRLIADRLTS